MSSSSTSLPVADSRSSTTILQVPSKPSTPISSSLSANVAIFSSSSKAVTAAALGPSAPEGRKWENTTTATIAAVVPGKVFPSPREQALINKKLLVPDSEATQFGRDQDVNKIKVSAKSYENEDMYSDERTSDIEQVERMLAQVEQLEWDLLQKLEDDAKALDDEFDLASARVSTARASERPRPLMDPSSPASKKKADAMKVMNATVTLGAQQKLDVRNPMPLKKKAVEDSTNVSISTTPAAEAGEHATGSVPAAATTTITAVAAQVVEASEWKRPALGNGDEEDEEDINVEGLSEKEIQERTEARRLRQEEKSRLKEEDEANIATLLTKKSMENLEAEELRQMGLDEREIRSLQGKGHPLTCSIIIRRCLDKELLDEDNEKEITKTAFALTHLHLDRIGIGRIDGLECFDKVTHLYLQNNFISTIENLDFVPDLKFLALMDNEIEKIEGVGHLENLLFLDLSNNRIKLLEGADLPDTIQVLNLGGNPCTLKQGYRQMVISAMPCLRILDGVEVTMQERISKKCYWPSKVRDLEHASKMKRLQKAQILEAKSLVDQISSPDDTAALDFKVQTIKSALKIVAAEMIANSKARSEQNERASQLRQEEFKAQTDAFEHSMTKTADQRTENKAGQDIKREMILKEGKALVYGDAGYELLMQQRRDEERMMRIERALKLLGPQDDDEEDDDDDDYGDTNQAGRGSGKEDANNKAAKLEAKEGEEEESSVDEGDASDGAGREDAGDDDGDDDDDNEV